MAERNNDSIERIDENPSRGNTDAANNPPTDPKAASSASRSAPKGTDEHPPRTRSTTEDDSSNP